MRQRAGSFPLLIVAVLTAATLAHAAELTPQEKALAVEARKEGAVTVLNPIFADHTGQALAAAFVKRYDLGDGFKFNNLRKGTGATIAQVTQEIKAGRFTVDVHRITLSLRPEDIVLHQARPDGPANVMEGDVIETVYLGSFLDCRVRVGPHEVGVQIDHDEQLRPGQRVFLTFQPDHGLCLTG